MAPRSLDDVEETSVPLTPHAIDDLEDTLPFGDLELLEDRLGYTFNDKSILRTALTHTSHEDRRIGHSYETLRYLGAAILDCLVATFLAENYPMARKLVLVEMKKHLISKSRMQDIAAALEVSKHVRVGDRFYISPEVYGTFVLSLVAGVFTDSGHDSDKTLEVIRALFGMNDEGTLSRSYEFSVDHTSQHVTQIMEEKRIRERNAQEASEKLHKAMREFIAMVGPGLPTLPTRTSVSL